MSQQSPILRNIIDKSGTTFYTISSISIVASILFIATSSVGINIYNSCTSFGDNDLSGLKSFFIIMLVIALLVLVGTIIALVIYVKFFSYKKLI